jgi:serine/threonine-protein kinase
VSWTFVGLGGLLLFAAGLGVMWLMRPVPSWASMAGLGLAVQPADEVNGGGYNEAPEAVLTPGGSRTAFAWTPDGQSLVFAGRKDGLQQLYVRRLDAAAATPLAGTAGAQVPAVSPDGRWVAFWAGRAIKKVPLGSGPVMELMSGVPEPPWGMAWGPAGDLFFGNSDRCIWVIPPTGASHAVTAAGADELSHRLPWPLPGGHALLYTVRKRLWTWGDEAVVVQALPTGRPKVLIENAADARYVPTGHLVFLRQGTLFAVPFDVDRLEVRGAPVAVLAPVAQALTAANVFDITGAGQFAVSSRGTLAWVTNPAVPDLSSQVVKVGRGGEVSPLPASPRNVGAVRLSRDGRLLALEVGTRSGIGIWIYDVDRGSLHPVMREGEAQWCAWSPDGRLFFGWLRDGRRSVAAIPANSDGSARPQVFLSAPYVFPASFTPGGDLIGVRDDREIVSLSAQNGHARVEPLNQTGQAAGWPELSPDGRWLVYGASLADGAASVTARAEVFVRSYPNPGQAIPVSVGGGRDPAWNPNGRELFYATLLDRSGRGSMMAVDFTPGTPPRLGPPRRLFDFEDSELAFGCSPLRCYSVAPDGRHFYTAQYPKLPPPRLVTHIGIVPNWLEELKAKVPR